MTPTIEEVKRVAEEHGLDRPSICGDIIANIQQLQAFAQHYIEVGEKKQRERSAKLFDGQYTDSCPGINISKAIRNNTGE